ncbi:MAG: PKD-like domain-containing protein [Bacteroidia bacterium]
MQAPSVVMIWSTFDLQDYLDNNGNGLLSTFSWSGAAVSGVSGISTTAQSGSVIDDQLVNATATPKTVVYTITPTSTPEGCQGASFTLTVTVNPSSQIQMLPADICPGDLVNVAALVRDYSFLARVVYFYDAHPDSGGVLIGSARMALSRSCISTKVFVSPSVTTIYYVWSSSRL